MYLSEVCHAVQDVKWTFDGPGSLTYSFLMALYHGGGEGGRQLVENTFDQIRKGQKPALP